MADIAVCAQCGEKKELCDSMRINGIKQPRLCVDCLKCNMHNGHKDNINDIYWLRQLIQLKDTETLKKLSREDNI